MLSTMKRSSMIILLLLLVLVPTQILVVTSIKREFDFFFFVQHWPGAECNTKKRCCYPTTGKPLADFGIHGLWPEYKDGTYPIKCDPNNKNPYDPSKIKDLIPALQKNWPSLACPSGDGSKIWTHEWVKHGTCSLSRLNQHEYFNAALKLKAKMNLLQMLAAKEVKPDGKFYSLGTIMDSISNRTGFTPGIECNVDKSNKIQLYQVIMCVDKSGSKFIHCPVYPGIKNCNTKGKQNIKFPSFTWPGTKEDDGITEQAEKPTTGSSSHSSSSKGAKSKTKNKQQEATSSTAGEQKNPNAGWKITGLLSGLWDPKKPTVLKPDHIENFGIHGLWPQYFNRNPYPQYCLKQDGGLPERYDFSKIEHLYDRLKKYWHSMASPYEDGQAVKSQNKFGLDKKEKDGIWEHEWEKHGTCSSFEQQRRYFEAALELRIPSNIENPLTWKNISNLLETLYEERIIPDGSSYPIDRIRDAIQNKIKVLPIIECNAKNELYQVHICLTKEHLELMDCIGDTVLVCKKGKDIIFPSFPEKAIDHKEL